MPHVWHHQWVPRGKSAASVPPPFTAFILHNLPNKSSAQQCWVCLLNVWLRGKIQYLSPEKLRCGYPSVSILVCAILLSPALFQGTNKNTDEIFVPQHTVNQSRLGPSAICRFDCGPPRGATMLAGKALLRGFSSRFDYRIRINFVIRKIPSL